MAKNPANKLILPNETLSSLGSISAIAEMLKMTKNVENKPIENKLNNQWKEINIKIKYKKKA